MNNESIILQTRINLMNAGIIKPMGNGQTITIKTDTGEQTVLLPEELHTFNGWLKRGMCVRKGEKHIAACDIWLAKKKTDSQDESKEENIQGEQEFVKKKAFFFTKDQVEPRKEYSYEP